MEEKGYHALSAKEYNALSAMKGKKRKKSLGLEKEKAARKKIVKKVWVSDLASHKRKKEKGRLATAALPRSFRHGRL